MKKTTSILLSGILSLSSCYHPESSTVRLNALEKKPIVAWYDSNLSSRGERKDSDGTKVIWRSRNIVSYSTGEEIIVGWIEECKRQDGKDTWHVYDHNLLEGFLLQELKKQNPELATLVEKGLLEQATLLELPNNKVKYIPRN